MLPVAVRSRPVPWLALLRDALAPHHVDLAAPVASALTSLTTFAASPDGVFADATTGARDMAEYCGLLLALHARVARWPAEALGWCPLPPRRVGGQEVAVTSPAVEAVCCLYNAAACTFRAGVAALALVHSEAARRSSRQSGKSASPSVHAKAAAKCFQAAWDYMTAVERVLDQLHPHSGGGACISSAERAALLAGLDVATNKALVEIGVAVSKYVFSTSSEAVAAKHDLLAKLACSAASLSIPASTSDELKLLPSVLLAAYYRHSAEHLYSTNPVEHMGLAVGHIAYAAKLLAEVQEEQAVAQSRGAEAAKGSSRIWTNFLLRRSEPSGGEAGQRGTSGAVDSAATGTSVTTLMDLFPLLETLQRDVLALHKKYAYENEVVYYLPVVAEENLPPPPPPLDVTPAKPRSEPDPLSGHPVLGPAAALAHSFDDLPTAEQLSASIARGRDTALAATRLKDLIVDVRDLARQLASVTLPVSITAAVRAIVPHLTRTNGNLGTILDAVVAEVTGALDEARAASDALRQHLTRRCGGSALPLSRTAAVCTTAEQFLHHIEELRERVAATLTLAPGNTAAQALQRLFPQRDAVARHAEIAERLCDEAARQQTMASGSDALMALCERLEAVRLEAMQLLVDTRHVTSPTHAGRIVVVCHDLGKLPPAGAALVLDLQSATNACRDEVAPVAKSLASRKRRHSADAERDVSDDDSNEYHTPDGSADSGGDADDSSLVWKTPRSVGSGIKAPRKASTPRGRASRAGPPAEHAVPVEGPQVPHTKGIPVAHASSRFLAMLRDRQQADPETTPATTTTTTIGRRRR